MTAALTADLTAWRTALFIEFSISLSSCLMSDVITTPVLSELRICSTDDSTAFLTAARIDNCKSLEDCGLLLAVWLWTELITAVLTASSTAN